MGRTEYPAVPVTARGQATRRRLLDAAAEVFGAKGFERASIVDVTQSARVAQGPSTSTSRTSGRSSASWSASSVTTIGAHRNLYRIVRQAEFVDEGLYRSYYRRLAAGYASGLEAAMRAGEVSRLDAETLAYCLMGIGDFLGMRWVLWEERDPPAQVLDTMTALIHHGIAPPHEGSRRAGTDGQHRAGGHPGSPGR